MMDSTDTPTSGDPTNGETPVDPQTQAANLDQLRNLLAGAARTDLAEPDADDAEGDEVDWVRTGVVRVWVGGKRYRLRRPFFGELRKLDVAYEDVIEGIKDLTYDTQVRSEELQADADKIDGDKRMTAKTRREKIRALRRESRDAARELNEHREDELMGWWRLVFETLSVDGVPEDLPGWLTSMTLPARAIQHWRSVPLGRGGQATGTTTPRS